MRSLYIAQGKKKLGIARGLSQKKSEVKKMGDIPALEQRKLNKARNNYQATARELVARRFPKEDKAVKETFKRSFADAQAERKKNLRLGQTLKSAVGPQEQKDAEADSVMQRTRAMVQSSDVSSSRSGIEESRAAAVREDTPGSVSSLGWGLTKDDGQWDDLMKNSGLYDVLHSGSPPSDNRRRNEECERNQNAVPRAGPSAGPTAGPSLLNPINIAAGKHHSRGSTDSSNGSSNETSLPMRPGISSAA